MRSDQINAFLGFVGTWFAVAVITLFVAAGIHDGGGLQESEHAGGLPAGVSQPYDDLYVVSDDATLDAPRFGGICGPEEGGSGVRSSAPVKAEGLTVVFCNDGQTWNVEKGPSPDYTSSLVAMVTNPFYAGGFGGALLLILGGGGIVSLSARRDRRRLASERAAEIEHAAGLAKRKRQALVEAWSQPDTSISDEDFERRLAEIDAEIDATAS